MSEGGIEKFPDFLDVRTYVKELELLVVAVGSYMGHWGLKRYGSYGELAREDLPSFNVALGGIQ